MKPFVHLHLHTEYSLLDGAIRIKEIFEACKERNMPAVAITDHGNMFGVCKFVDAAAAFNKTSDFKVKPIIGTEFYITDDMTKKSGGINYGHLVLLAKNQEGYSNLVKLNSIAYVEGFYYKPRIDYKVLKEHAGGLVCLSGCLAGHIQNDLMNGLDGEAEKKAVELKNIFGEDFYMELMDHGIPEQKRIIPKQIALAEKLGIECVVTNDCHYLNKEDAEAQDVLLCVNTGKRVDDVDRMKMGTEEFYVKTYDEMLENFKFIPKALDNTLEIAEKCNATVIYGQRLEPEYILEPGQDKRSLLRELTWEGVKNKYGTITPELKTRTEYELDMIEKMGFEDYFLVVWDFCKFCADNDIPVGPGRGSGAGSVVCYALNITKLEPMKYDLFFERFLNPYRVSMPDIDLDFCFNRVGEVEEYVKQKYGSDKVCKIITFGTLKAKQAFKDVARVYNVSFAEVNATTKFIPTAISKGDPYFKNGLKKAFGLTGKEEDKKLIIPELITAIEANPTLRKVAEVASKIEGMPRHTSMHAAGVVICKKSVSDCVPLSRNGEDITTQFDMIELERIGILKMDFLRLKTLTDLKGAVDIVKKKTGKVIDLDSMSYDDPGPYKMIAEGNTDTVFQLESGGMKDFMKQLKPTCFEDIIAGVAMYRPGPMDNIPQFCESKHDEKKIRYLVPELEPILKNTYGVMVYQEQVMQVCTALAGYDLGQADIVRKYMGKKDYNSLVKERDAFINGDASVNPPKAGTTAKGLDPEKMNHLFDEMIKFGDYAFNKSHSAVYAAIAYQTAYIKYYYNAEYLASVLNNRITNSDELKKYITVAKEQGLEILPPDINKSEAFFTAHDNAIRYGLAALKGVGEKAVEEVVKKRDEIGGFKDFYSFVSALSGASLNKRIVEAMVFSGALDSLGLKRSQMIEMYPELFAKIAKDREVSESGQFSFFDDIKVKEQIKVEVPDIPEYNQKTKLKFEKEVVGAYVSGHPLDEHRKKFKNFSFDSSKIKVKEEGEAFEAEPNEEVNYETNLKDGERVTCGGLVQAVKRIAQKKDNRSMAIVTVEDLYGTFDVMVFANTLEKCAGKLIEDAVVTVRGKVSVREGKVPIIVAETIAFWDEEEVVLAESDEPTIFGLAEKPKKLYLKYSSKDVYVNNKVLSSLNANIGETEVIVKCSETGNVFKPTVKVTVSAGLLAELTALIGKDNIVEK